MLTGTRSWLRRQPQHDIMAIYGLDSSYINFAVKGLICGLNADNSSDNREF